MKITSKLLLLLSILCSTILPIQSNLTPENTFIAFDLDEVLLQKTFWFKPKLIFGGIALHPLNGYSYIRSLANVKSAYTYDADRAEDVLYDEYGDEINGLTFHSLYHGMRDKRLTPYIAWIVETMECARNFITGTKQIIEYLKSAGYPIVFATNKDRISYDITAQTLGDEFTNLATMAFVAHPANTPRLLNTITQFAQLTDTPESYRTLAEHAINIQPTNTIVHIPAKKPELMYYQQIHSTLGTDKNFIFIDDKKFNVDGFNILQSSTNAFVHGIHFKNPIQLADELVKLGILSEIDDQEFLQEIRNPGILGTIKLALKPLTQLWANGVNS